MKKKTVFVFLVLFFCSYSFSETRAKMYEDKVHGYSGSAGVIFLGNKRDISPDEACENIENFYKNQNTTIRNTKPTKEEIFLLNSALDEYDIEKDEIYNVVVVSSKTLRLMIFVVVITNPKKYTYDYIAFYVDE